jgi:uncharacterized membrane protein YdjX (TVP38/TMEM64 family)
MIKHNTRRPVKQAVIATVILVTLTLVLWFNRDSVWGFVKFAGDRQAVSGYLDRLGFVGPLVLMGLVGLQVLIPSLPAEPPMIAGAYVYGFAAGFLMNWSASVAASQAAFYLARHGGRPLVERLVPARVLDRWTRTASEKGTMFFLLAFMIPPVPSDILIYVAGLSEIKGRRFFAANVCGRMPMIVLLTLVGAYGLRITPVMILGLTVTGLLMLVAWFYYMRDRPEAAESGSDQTTAVAPPRRLPETVQALVQRGAGRAQPGQSVDPSMGSSYLLRGRAFGQVVSRTRFS